MSTSFYKEDGQSVNLAPTVAAHAAQAEEAAVRASDAAISSAGHAADALVSANAAYDAQVAAEAAASSASASKTAASASAVTATSKANEASGYANAAAASALEAAGKAEDASDYANAAAASAFGASSSASEAAGYAQDAEDSAQAAANSAALAATFDPNDYVPKTGGTFSGDVTVEGSVSTSGIINPANTTDLDATASPSGRSLFPIASGYQPANRPGLDYVGGFEAPAGSTNYRWQMVCANPATDTRLYVRHRDLSGWFGWSKVVLENPNGNVGIGLADTGGCRLAVSSATHGGQARLHRDTSSNGTAAAMLSLAANNSAGAATDFATINAHIESAASTNENGALVLSTRTSGALSEKMRVTSSGNVGIGTASPAYRLHVSGTVQDTWITSQRTDATTTQGAGFMAVAGSSLWTAFGQRANGDAYLIHQNNTGSLLLGTNSHVHMRIDSAGNILVGKAASDANIVGSEIRPGRAVFTNSNNDCLWLYRQGTDGQIAAFVKGTSQVGSITVNAASTAYNTSSDYRLKFDIQPLTGAIERVKALQAHRFKWLNDPDGPAVDGFIAHEAQEVVPEAVTGYKDHVEDIGTASGYREYDENGDPVPESYEELEGVTEADAPEGYTWVKTGERPVYQGIDQSKLVPLLTAALQEAIARIEALEAYITEPAQ